MRVIIPPLGSAVNGLLKATSMPCLVIITAWEPVRRRIAPRSGRGHGEHKIRTPARDDR